MIRNSNIGDLGADSVAQLIAHHPKLSEIELFNCSITEEGG